MKKIISFIIAVSLLCSSAIFTAHANEFDYSMHEKEVNVLNDLGISTKDESGALNEASPTRAELAVLAMKALGFSSIPYTNQENPFTDVPSSHWAYSYIMHAKNIGLFNGTSKTTFSPDAIIDSAQAIATMVKMLNYKSQAELTGGYPSGYLSIAASLKILDGTSLASDNTITREQLYVLLYNTLHTEMLVEMGINGKDESFIKDGSTILTKNLNIKYVEGVITADSETAIFGEAAKSKDRFFIGNMQFEGKNINVLGKVGRRVRVYYRETNTNILDALSLQEEENTEITLSAESVTDFDYANGIYKAMDGDKEKSYRIGDKYYLSYNGEAIYGSDPLSMEPSCGTVTLIDNNGDGIFDVVIVNEFYNLIFGGYNSYTNIITDAFDSSKNINLELYSKVISDTEDFSSLDKNTVLSVFKGKASEYIKIKESANIISGTITQITEDGTYIADGNEYRLSESLRCLAAGLKAGGSYTLYLDIYNAIAYYEVSTASQGGYILKFAAPTGLEGAKVQILIPDGSLKSFELANKVTIETPGGTSSIDGKNAGGYLSGSRQYVLFNQNKDKQINKITTAKIIGTSAEYETMGGYPLYKLDYYIEEWPRYDEGNSYIYRAYKSKNMGYGNWLILGENTIVMNVVPETQADYSADDFICTNVKNCLKTDETINIVKNNSGNKGNREIDVYKIGDAGIEPDIFIRYLSEVNKNVSDDSDFIVIKDLSQVLDAKTGDVCYKLTYMQGASENTGIMADDFTNTRAQILSSPYGSGSLASPSLNSSKQIYKAGDIAKITKDIKGKITNLCLIYDGENKKMSFSELSTYNRVFRIVDGTVRYINGSYLEITSSTGNPLERSRINGCNIIVSEPDKDIIRTGTTADISIDDHVVIYSRHSDNKTVVVYKKR